MERLKTAFGRSEHHLAKVRVAGSNPVVRSKEKVQVRGCEFSGQSFHARSMAGSGESGIAPTSPLHGLFSDA
jgi:hypothetical protein